MTLSKATPEFLKTLKDALPADTITDAPESYLTEERGLVKGTAACLARPRNVQEVAMIVRLCNQHRVGLIPYAGGTGLTGGQVANLDPSAVILSVERMASVRDVDVANNTITVEAGVILENVQQAADDVDRLFPLSLAAQGSCRIGGNLATNAGGTQVLRYGNTRDLCLGLEAVLPDGSIYHGLTGLRKDNTGFDIRNLLVGSEGALGVITAATLKLYAKPKEVATAMAVVPSPAAAVELLGVMQSGLDGLVSGFELIHGQGLDFLAETMPDVRQPFTTRHEWMVLIEVAGGQGANLDARLMSVLETAIENGLVEDVLIAQNTQQAQQFWQVRESIPLANKLIGGISSHDISVPISALAEFIQAGFDAIAKLGDLRVNCFGHVGDGNLHYNVYPAKGQVRAEVMHLKPAIIEVIYDLVHEFGGSFSAEHGIGRLKVDDLEKYSDPAKLATIRTIKAAFDPNGIMNPGVIVR
ncbi:MAG: FAD-binding oxidoreductase [Amylibacter sp.]|nr:FAD-binding oxidoreductase [Amylibacter sp.]